MCERVRPPVWAEVLEAGRGDLEEAAAVGVDGMRLSRRSLGGWMFRLDRSERSVGRLQLVIGDNRTRDVVGDLGLGGFKHVSFMPV